MGLKNIDVNKTYRNIENKVIETFFVPCLRESVTYKRAVGFFTLGALSNLTKGIIPLIQSEGKIQIISSPLFNEKDFKVLELGIQPSDELIKERLMDQLIKVDSENLRLEMDLIANLISANIIEIKIATKSRGIYHEKIGIFEDKNKDYISFVGSSNETVSAQLENYESFKVFRSWDENVSDYAEDEYIHFNNLWNGLNENINVVSLNDAVRNKIIEIYKVSASLVEVIEKIEKTNETDEVSNEKKLYEYQENAIDEFVENDYKHFFEMATGTGKTFTSVRAIKKLVEDKKKVFAIFLVPQIDIQDQWYNELRNSGINKIYTLGGNLSKGDWEDEFQKAQLEFNLAGESVYYLAVYDSFFSKLYNKLNRIKELAIIVDEAHNLSINQLGKMPNNAKYRLGLSATPEKHSLEETKEILKYFLPSEKESFKYSIEEAIERGFLSKYYYYPIFVKLTEDEFERYQRYSVNIATERSKKIIDYEKLYRLLNERSLIVKKSKSKVDKLEEMVNDSQYSFINSIVYCGQGKEEGEEEKIIDKVTRILYEHKGLRVSTFTSNTVNRKKVLEEFEKGYYDTLVAIKCFDEGVDVPKLDKIYIMASDRLKRQTIQRRGRVLRISKQSGKDFAFIYDFVILPPDNEKKIGKNLVINEFHRLKEYARLAMNLQVIEKQKIQIENHFNISEEDYNVQEIK